MAEKLSGSHHDVIVQALVKSNNNDPSKRSQVPTGSCTWYHKVRLQASVVVSVSSHD